MRKTVLAAVTVILLTGVTGAVAQEDVIDEMIEACKPEIAAYCSQVTPGEGRLLACFYAHGDKLSGRCEWALYDGAAKLEQLIEDIALIATECEDDLLKYCGKVEVGEGRVGTCLLAHQAEVTEACAAAMTETELKAVED